jgi:hypothetical protein
MGFNVSWIARSGESTKELLDACGRRPTGERHGAPDVGFYLLELPRGVRDAWVVLIADGYENVADLNALLASSLSEQGNETLYFWCSDTVMATELACFQSGELVWSIQYDCDDEAKQPAIDGNIPPITREILADLRANQRDDSDADYVYSLAAQLGRRLLGFHHAMRVDTDDPKPFQVLAR